MSGRPVATCSLVYGAVKSIGTQAQPRFAAPDDDLGAGHDGGRGPATQGEEEEGDGADGDRAIGAPGRGVGDRGHAVREGDGEAVAADPQQIARMVAGRAGVHYTGHGQSYEGQRERDHFPVHHVRPAQRDRDVVAVPEQVREQIRAQGGHIHRPHRRQHLLPRTAAGSGRNEGPGPVCDLRAEDRRIPLREDGQSRTVGRRETAGRPIAVGMVLTRPDVRHQLSSALSDPLTACT
jgi:hypothetical protein